MDRAMFGDVDLRELAELTAPERAFLTVYLESPRSLKGLNKQLDRLRPALAGPGQQHDEREHFDRNVKAVWEYLERGRFKSGSICLFSCWVLDLFRAIPLPVPVADCISVDSSPLIRPLAELQDEYEDVAVVVADNRKARVYLVSSAVAESEASITGNVKNHVRKGGWSQQRYERRRDKLLLHYARDIADELGRLDREQSFRRILLVGGREIMRVLQENLPDRLGEKVVGHQRLDLRREQEFLNEDVWQVLSQQERRSEQELWEKIRGEYLRGGLGVAGLEDVLQAAQQGRVEQMAVDRTYRPEGTRCRGCEHLHAAPVEKCTACGSCSVYPVDIVNEICEILHCTGAEADFVDPAVTLTEAGQIAAFLRY